MSIKSKRKTRRVVAACVEAIWAMEADKLDQVCGFLDLRASGYELTKAEVAEVLAANARSVDDGEEMAADIVDGVAMTGLYGVMAPRANLIMQFSGGTSTQQLAAEITDLANNVDVKTIILEIDSPGGVVTGTEELRQAIAAAAESKRVVAIARGTIASAAYYAGSAATELIATPSTEVGSIGVYSIHREFSKAAESNGVTFRVFRAGEYKAAGNEYEALTDKMAKAIQARVDAPYKQFLSAVAENRGIPVETVEATFGQGQTFLADEALERGMIDRIAGFDAVIQEEMFKAKESTTTVATTGDTYLVEDGDGIRYATSRETVDGGVVAPQISVPVGDETATTLRRPEMDPTIRAALVAKGLISNDATDEQAQAALTAGFAARGEDVPEKAGATVSAILAWNKLEAPAPAPAPDAALAERNRIQDIRARGAILGVEAEAVEAAINGDLTVEKAVDKWTADMIRTRQPATADVETGESEHEKVFGAAMSVLGARCGLNEPIAPQARDMTNMRAVDIGRRCLASAGIRATGDDEADALAFLQMGGTNRQMFGSGIYAAEPSYNVPGSFPNIMSNLAGKILDTAFEMADVTYPIWCARMTDAADLKPRTIIAAGVFSDLDEIKDDEMPKDLPLSEELMNWIQVDRYANKVGLTPVMIANDDMDAFSTQLSSLAYAHEAKLNAMCVAQIGTNPTMPDGTALFAGATSDHYNLIATGTVVSSANLAAMRTLHRLQPGVGTSKRIKAPPKIALVPPAQEENALQALAPLGMFAEDKVPVTDATINTQRGVVRPVVENDLVDHSATAWYTIADPARRRTIVHCFQRGYGRGGQRETWFENGRKTRYVALEGRFAVVAASWRGICKNPGA